MYVQLKVSNVAIECLNGYCGLSPPKDNLMAWLYIELYCFYIYMLAAICYIVYN